MTEVVRIHLLFDPCSLRDAIKDLRDSAISEWLQLSVESEISLRVCFEWMFVDPFRKIRNASDDPYPPGADLPRRVSQLREQERGFDFYLEDEVRLFLRNCSSYFFPIACCAVYTGMRSTRSSA